MNSDSQYLTKFANLFSQDRMGHVRDLFLQCSSQKESRACFESALLEYGTEVTKGMLDLGPVFQRFYAFDNLANEVSQFYRIILDSSQALIKDHAEKTWEQCKSIPADDSDAPRVGPFAIGEGYMVSSLYNCLNDHFEETVGEIISDLRYESRPVQTEMERNYLKKDVTRLLSGEFQAIFDRESADERKHAQTLQNDPTIEKRILSNFDWVKVGTVQSDCRQLALSMVPFQPYFALRKELFKTLLSQANCQKVTNSQAFNDWSRKNESHLKSEVMSYYEERILKQGHDIFSRCQSSSPEKGILDSIFKSKFDKCFEEGWKSMEEQSANDVSRVDIAYKMNISYDALLAESAKKRKGWMKIVKKEKD